MVLESVRINDHNLGCTRRYGRWGPIALAGCNKTTGSFRATFFEGWPGGIVVGIDDNQKFPISRVKDPHGIGLDDCLTSTLGNYFGFAAI
jgi:hypothetical protein